MNSRRSLKVCLRILADNEKVNTGVKRANYVVGKLLRGTGVNVSPGSSPTEHLDPLTERLTDNIDLDDAEINSIVDSFCISERGSPGQRSHLPPSYNSRQPQAPYSMGSAAPRQELSGSSASASFRSAPTSLRVPYPASSSLLVNSCVGDHDPHFASQQPSIQAEPPPLDHNLAINNPNAAYAVHLPQYDQDAAFNDIIFGLHSTEFSEWWPDFEVGL